jgi:pimeloyl-ACP methyl ester carboxylesterase
MKLEVDGKAAFAYTANHAIDPAKRTVVFVHGAGLDHSWFGLQSRYFGYHGWNVLALDLPGHGRSAGPALATVEQMADWVAAVLKTLKIPKASLVGHSMGSLVLLEFAARHAAQCERIALIAVAFPMRVSPDFLDAAKRDHIDAFDMHTIWGHAAQVPLGGDPTPGMWMYGDTQARLERLAPGVLYNDLKACNDYVLEGDVSCPALFILGKRDMMTPPKAASDLTKRLKNSKSVLIDFSGHSLMSEAPDATLDALIDFFRT